MSATKVRAQLALLHEATSHGISRMDALLSSGAFPATVNARLSMQCAHLRAHRARVMARLAALGRPFTLVPAPVTQLGAPSQEVEHLVHLCDVMGERYRKAAQLAREGADVSTAWVCELNERELVETARALMGLLEMERKVVA